MLQSSTTIAKHAVVNGGDNQTDYVQSSKLR